MGERPELDSLSAKCINFHLEELSNLPPRQNYSINLLTINNN